MNTLNNPTSLKVIYVVSIVIPAVVAILLFTPLNLGISGEWVKFLPTLNAVVNSLTSVVLIGAFIAVKNKNVTLHKSLMLTALFLGVVFLLSYVLYHSSSTTVKFGDANHDGVLSAEELAEVGMMRGIYVFILLSHIVLSIGVVPLVLLAFQRALTGQIDKHRKLVKFTFPVWLYVSITGVIVYLMISPYYF